ncbi:hypothetical protein ABIC27_006254, partial [Streptomyces sp. PvR034]
PRRADGQRPKSCPQAPGGLVVAQVGKASRAGD